jgi:hypothetical protein
MKTPRIIPALLMAVLFTACVTTPEIPESIKAAGWVEVSAKPYVSWWSGIDYTEQIGYAIALKPGFDPLDIRYKNKGAEISGQKQLIKELTFEYRLDALHDVRYRTPEGKIVSVKERRWIKKPGSSVQTFAPWFHEYRIGEIEYSNNNLYPLITLLHEGKTNTTIQMWSGGPIRIPLNLLFQDFRIEYEGLKSTYIVPKNKSNNNPEFVRMTKLLTLSLLFADMDFTQKLRKDSDEIDRSLQSAKIAEETAKRNRIAQEANLFSTYQDFADNARTNIAMLNNRSYWQQGMVYKLVFGGSDVSLNSEYIKAANQTMEGAYANALVQLAQGLLGEALVNQATGRRGTPSADSKYVVFMKHTITDWTSRTRFSSTVMTENGIYPLHIEASTMIDYIQKNHPDGFSYCRGYFVVEQLSPTLVLRPIQLGPIELWQVERDTGVGFDEIIKSAMSK